MTIDCLPVELMSRVFIMLINDVNAEHDPRKRLMRVCRRWRAILTGLVAAWTNISWSTGLAKVPGAIRCHSSSSFARAVRRAVRGNLEITLEFPAYPARPFDFRNDDWASLTVNNGNETWVSRCRRLMLVVPPGSSTAILDAIFGPFGYQFASLMCLVLHDMGCFTVRGALDVFLDAIANTAANLRRLELISPYDTHIVRRLLDRGDILVRIREFKLPSHTHFSAWEALPNLTYLHVTSKNPYSDHSMDLSQLVAPMLTRLRLDGPFQPLHIPPLAIIGQLEWLELVGFPSELTDTLRAMRPPTNEVKSLTSDGIRMEWVG